MIRRWPTTTAIPRARCPAPRWCSTASNSRLSSPISWSISSRRRSSAVARARIDARAEDKPAPENAERHAIGEVRVAERLDDIADQRRHHREAKALRHVHRRDAAAGQSIGEERTALRHDHRAEGAEEAEGGEQHDGERKRWLGQQG